MNQAYAVHSIAVCHRSINDIKLEKWSKARDTYPTRHVVHKLGTSHNIEVRDTCILVLVDHDVLLNFSHHNIQFHSYDPHKMMFAINCDTMWPTIIFFVIPASLTK